MITTRKREVFCTPPAVAAVAAAASSQEAELLQLYRGQTTEVKAAALNMLVLLGGGTPMMEAARLFAMETGQDVEKVLALTAYYMPTKETPA